MPQILVIDSSPRGDQSASKQLTDTVLAALRKKHPDSHVQRRDLTLNPLPHLDPVTLAAFANQPDKHSDNERRAVQHSNEVIKELLAADIVVIGSPMWNFSVPSVLKAYIDHLARAGHTFKYTATGPVGLATGKKVYLALSSGGVYSSGPGKAKDFLEPYLRAVLGFMGMTDVTAWRAEGIARADLGPQAVAKAQAAVQLA